MWRRQNASPNDSTRVVPALRSTWRMRSQYPFGMSRVVLSGAVSSVTTGNRWYQVNSRSIDHRILQAGGLTIDADDHPALGRKIKARQDIDHPTARRQLAPDHAPRRVRHIAHEPAVQMHLNVHGRSMH